MFGDRHQLPLDIAAVTKARADLIDLSEIRLFQGETVRGECLLRIVHQPLAELRVFHCAAHDGADAKLHDTAHVFEQT